MEPFRDSRLLPWLSDSDVKKLPAPASIIGDILYQGHLAVLYGDPGLGKTFVALGMALSVATGEPWQGRPINPGPVLYVCAEGIYGFGPRLRAWEQQHPPVTRPIPIHFYPDAIDLLLNAHVDELVRRAQELGPQLVVIDTLAPCMFRGDEDNSSVMGSVVDAARRLRLTSSHPAVMFVHHPTKTKPHERGSGALRGAANTMIRLAGNQNSLRFICDKQRDAADFDEIELRLQSVALENGESSCVVVERTASLIDGGSGTTGPTVTDRQIRLLRHLVTSPLLTKDWQARADIGDSTFYREMRALKTAGYVGTSGTGKQTTNWLTATGTSAARGAVPGIAA